MARAKITLIAFMIIHFIFQLVLNGKNKEGATVGLLIQSMLFYLAGIFAF